MTRRAEQKRRTHARILEVATTTFEELGYDATTFQKVAKRAGVSVGSVVAHFPDKGSLVSACFHEAIARCVDEGFATLPDGDAVERFVHLADALYRWYAEHPALAIALLRETLFLEGPFGEIHARQRLDFVAKVAELMPASAPRELLAHGFFADYFAVLVGALQGAQHTGTFDRPTALAQLTALLRTRLPSRT